MPSAPEFPETLRRLSLINGMEIGDLNWEADVYKVIKRIEELFEQPREDRQHQKEKEVPPPPQSAAPPQRAVPKQPGDVSDLFARLFKAALFVAVVIIVIVFWNYPQKAKDIFDRVHNIFFTPKPTPANRAILPTNTSNFLPKWPPKASPTPLPSFCRDYTVQSGITLCWIRPEHFEILGYEPGFYISVNEITRSQWKSLLGSENPPPSDLDDLFPDFSVKNVSRTDALKFVGKLKETNNGYSWSLPTYLELQRLCWAKEESTPCLGDQANVTIFKSGFRVVAKTK